MTKLPEFNLMSDPAYNQAWGKLQELRGEVSKQEKDLNELLMKGKAETVQGRKEKQVRAILSGHDPSDVEEVEKHREDVTAAYDRLNLFKRAVTEQEGLVKSERVRVSERICQKLIPKHRDLVKRLALAYIEFGKLVVEEQSFRESLNDADIAYGGWLRPMAIAGIGDPLDRQSRLAQWLIEAVEYKFIQASDIPKAFREGWYRSSGFKFKGDVLSISRFDEAEYAAKKGLLDRVKANEKESGKLKGRWAPMTQA